MSAYADSLEVRVAAWIVSIGSFLKQPIESQLAAFRKRVYWSWTQSFPYVGVHQGNSGNVLAEEGKYGGGHTWDGCLKWGIGWSAAVHDHLQGYRASASTAACNSNSGGIAAKVLDVIPNPVESKSLIEQTSVPCSLGSVSSQLIST